MNTMLRGVVNGENGTGARAQVGDFVVAGKTGTAQMIDPRTGGYFQSRLVASFVGFVPADDPKFVILVVLEDVHHGQFGGLIAAPVFSAIATAALDHLNVPSHPHEYSVASLLPEIAPPAEASDLDNEPVAEWSDAIPALVANSNRAVPNFKSLSLRAALEMARSARVAVEVHGDGYVTDQSPAPGARLDGSPVKLNLAAMSAENEIPVNLNLKPIVNVKLARHRRLRSGG
jgi:cell division protein FtsI (penicillin-binding protein 3)